ncbi:MAG: SsrA-binding protein SmpB [Planctomycetes bacterium]|nr:SsrA-binding protein SmpB [Planctomycetota bacterium]
MKTESGKIIQKNKKAYFDYEILDKIEAGLVLKGTEVKSIRDGNVSISEGYGRIDKGEAFIYNMEISPYRAGNIYNHEPKRPRKLLMKKTEIRRLVGNTTQKGLTLIPLALYFRNGFAKIEIGLARGKKLYDKRESIKNKMAQREINKIRRK